MKKVIEEKKQSDVLNDLWRKADNEEYKSLSYVEECNPESIGKLPLISKRVFELDNHKEAKETFINLYGSDVMLLKNKPSTAQSF